MAGRSGYHNPAVQFLTSVPINTTCLCDTWPWTSLFSVEPSVYNIWGGLPSSFTTDIVHSNLDFLCRSVIPENIDLSTRFFFFLFLLQLHRQDESPQRNCWTVLTHAWLTSSLTYVLWLQLCWQQTPKAMPPEPTVAFTPLGRGQDSGVLVSWSSRPSTRALPSQQTWWRALLWSSLCNTRPATELQQWTQAKARIQAEAKNNYTALADPFVE